MIEGIDVSDCQGIIDWKKVKSNGITFAFCKATDGLTFVSKRFKQNWDNMKAEGVIRGAYHFCHPKNDPVEEAKHFVNTVGPLDGPDMLVLDIEDEKSTLSKEQFINWTLTFLETVEKLSNVTPIVYTGGPYFDKNGGKPSDDLVKRLSRFPLWLAAYTKTPDKFVPYVWKNVGWMIWQRSGDVAPSGETPLHVPGINCVVDRDQYRGTIDEFKAFAYGLHHAPVIVADDTPIVNTDPPIQPVPEPVINTPVSSPEPNGFLDVLLGFLRKIFGIK